MFWESKRVLITGHTGFKGSWLSLWLQNLNADVIGYALPSPTNPNLFTIANIADHMTSILGDIRDYQKIHDVIKQYRPEIVIHMAAQSLVRVSYQNPMETYTTNVLGTLNLLEAIRQIGGVKVVLNVTTDKCYENKEWIWGYRENDPMGGFDPYSSSKACSELITSAYRNSYFDPAKYEIHKVALSSARAGNVMGGGDWATDRLIPDIINAWVESRPVKIRHPHAIRPWQHVLEPLSGYLLLAQKLYESPSQYAEAWNFGPPDNEIYTVQWIVEHLLKLWGNNNSWELEENSQPHEATYLKLDCSKANTKLNWKPRWSLEKALQMVTDWFNAYQSKQDMREITQQQICDYKLSS